VRSWHSSGPGCSGLTRMPRLGKRPGVSATVRGNQPSVGGQSAGLTAARAQRRASDARLLGVANQMPWHSAGAAPPAVAFTSTRAVHVASDGVVESTVASSRLRRGAPAWAISGGLGPWNIVGLRQILHHQGAPGREKAPNKAISQREEGPSTRHGPARASVDQGNGTTVSRLEALRMRLWQGTGRDRWYALADHIVA
jgi:hypothetical protein